MERRSILREEKDNKIAGFSEKELSIFGLTSIETKIILCLLERGLCGVSKISRVTSIPHTSIHSAIRRLREQGFVRRVSKGYASIWKVVSLEKIRKNLNKALKPFGNSLSQVGLCEQDGLNVSDETHSRIFEGISSILKIYQWFFLNNYGGVVREVHGTESFRNMIKKVGKESMAYLNDIRVINRVYAEIILSKSSLEVYREYATVNRSWAVKLGKNNDVVYLASEEGLEKDLHIIIADNSAVIIDWERETLELIRLASTHKILGLFFQNLKASGELTGYFADLPYLFEEKGRS